ncbi:MAG: hypothetical protein HQL87_05220 [Magnetococcales bacterium]|nr:hypothetical protein [Magnetococcales bacterium]
MAWRLVAEWVTIGVIMALVRRYAIEPESIGLLCQAGTAPWWCGLRHALILAVHFKMIGYLATTMGVIALWSTRGIWGRLAMDLGAAGLVFYNVSWAAAGFVLGLLAVVDSDRKSC